DFVVELDPPPLPVRAPSRHVLDRLEQLDEGIRAKTVVAQPLERLHMRRELDPLAVARSVDPDRERSLSRDLRVELAERAGRRVAWIRSGLLALGCEPL